MVESLCPMKSVSGSEKYEFACSHLNSFGSKNGEAVIQLTLNGEFMECSVGARIIVLDSGIFLYEILVIEGQCKGHTGTVAFEWIQESNGPYVSDVLHGSVAIDWSCVLVHCDWALTCGKRA